MHTHTHSNTHMQTHKHTLQEYACIEDKLTHFLTYADNNAVGYFMKQGFTKEVTLEKERCVRVCWLVTKKRSGGCACVGWSLKKRSGGCACVGWSLK